MSTAIFLAILALGIRTDIQLHLSRNRYPNDFPIVSTNFLYYSLVWVISFFVRSKVILGVLFSVLLGLAVMWKYKASRAMLPIEGSGNSQWVNRWLFFSPVALVFVFSLPVNFNLSQYYLGQFPANVWHNSTTIAVMPFVVLAFHAAYRYLKSPEATTFFWLGFWSLLVYFIKPSILPIFVVTLPGFALLKHSFGKVFRNAGVYALVMVVLLLWPMLFVSGGSNGKNAGGGLAVGLFEVWSLYSNTYLLSLLASLLFPLSVIAVYFKHAKSDFLLQLAWVAWFIAFAMFAILYETGEFMKAGNLGWQVIMASYLLFLASLTFFNKHLKGQERTGFKEYTVGAIFLLHLLSGLVYLVKMMFLGFH